MSTKKRIHNIILALFLIVIFIAPVTIKGVHHHSVLVEKTFHNTHGYKLSATEKACPICQFEFVTFFSEIQPQYFYPLTARPVKDAELVSLEVKFSFNCYFHRGPPIS
jgi:hypothetical protein